MSSRTNPDAARLSATDRDPRGETMIDPRAVFARVEARLGRRTSPAHLRRMAVQVRHEARVHEDRAAEYHNRADYYEDLAREREQAREPAQR